MRLPAIGFKFNTLQLFWLTAMPGLSGGTLRLVHTFLIPIYGTRVTITTATFLKIFPMLWLGFAVQNPDTPYSSFLIIAFLCGMGGGDFSSYMPSTSVFFPKSLQGTALGLQAGLGNLGVSIVQFVTPWIIAFPLVSAFGGPQPFVKGAVQKDIWLQNAAYWYVPYLAVAGVLCAMFLKSVPGRKPAIGEMVKSMTNDKHVWFCVITYVMTFGSFSGLAAAFPLMIKSIYGGFPDAPDPLKYAFLGPLVGSAVRFIGGPLADKYGGSPGHPRRPHHRGLALISAATAHRARAVLRLRLDHARMFLPRASAFIPFVSTRSSSPSIRERARRCSVGPAPGPPTARCCSRR